LFDLKPEPFLKRQASTPGALRFYIFRHPRSLDFPDRRAYFVHNRPLQSSPATWSDTAPDLPRLLRAPLPCSNTQTPNPETPPFPCGIHEHNAWAVFGDATYELTIRSSFRFGPALRPGINAMESRPTRPPRPRRSSQAAQHRRGARDSPVQQVCAEGHGLLLSRGQTFHALRPLEPRASDSAAGSKSPNGRGRGRPGKAAVLGREPTCSSPNWRTRSSGAKGAVCGPQAQRGLSLFRHPFAQRYSFVFLRRTPQEPSVSGLKLH